MYYTHHA
jgi:hypothetical protein